MFAGTFLVVVSLLSGSGCGGGVKSSGNQLSGTVKLNGTPLPGVNVAAVGADGSRAGALTDLSGKYVIESPPKGTVQIVVTSLGGASPSAMPGGTGPGAPPSSTVSVPAKYATPNNGLSYEVKGGKETYNIDLTP